MKYFTIIFLFCNFYTTTAAPNQEDHGHILRKSIGGRTNRVKRVVSMPGIEQSGLPTKEEQDFIVKLHNDFRKKEPASDMTFMEWDDRLAKTSQEWLSRCRWGHGQPENWNEKYGYPKDWNYLGQNIAFYTDLTYDRTGYANQSMYSFWIEKNDYNYDTQHCTTGNCGHYTQIVWAKTQYVGCAVSICPKVYQEHGNGLASKQKAWYIVCNYYPGGNAYGVQPFQKGPQCSKCASGDGWCYEGMCRGKESCDKSGVNCACKAQCKNCATVDREKCNCKCHKGWLGSDCSEPCKNHAPECGANPGWPFDYCDDPNDTTRRLCPLLCKKCEAAEPGEECQDPSKISTIEDSSSGESELSQETDAQIQKSPPDLDNHSQAKIGDGLPPPAKVGEISQNNHKSGTATVNTHTSEKTRKLIAKMTFRGKSKDEFHDNWEGLKYKLVDAINQFCTENYQMCCKTENKGSLTGREEFIGTHSVLLPEVLSDEGGAYIEFHTNGSPDNKLCQ